MTARVLLVEDNEMNRDMLSRRLQRAGYDVLTMPSSLQRRQPDSCTVIGLGTLEWT